MPSLIPSWLIVSAILIPIAWIWRDLVNEIVPEVYLDEFFHVGQASTYWRGEWTRWDPKITTPPGLYVYSWVINKISSLGSPVLVTTPSVSLLRFGNTALLIVAVPFQVLRLLRGIQTNGRLLNGQNSAHDIHTTLNICLFPVLFFFSGLYYTDLISVQLVLVTYFQYFRRSAEPARWDPIVGIFVCGIASLTTRQTNIFWVAVFLGGSELVRTFPRRPIGRGSNVWNVAQVAWSEGVVHDVKIAEARMEDIMYFVITIVVASVRDIHRVIPRLAPYIWLLAAFGTFVLINGSVVLGDKENHVASLHLPQMLYIWAYFAFFSWPLLVPYILNAAIPPTILPSVLRHQSLRDRIPRRGAIVDIVTAMAAAARLNTIVHPFTLADNRHYVFYVFRILMWNPWIKLAAVPVYFICSWACVTALGPLRRVKDENGASAKKKKDSDASASTSQDENEESAVQLSFVLIWLASTALSLITAPLVEPRYFIIPWVVWRLNLPAISPSKKTNTRRTSLLDNLPHDDYRLYLETLWYLFISVATGYMFLYRGFEWPQEPGKVQRFMW